MKIKTRIKAGITGDCSDAGCGLNHNQTAACALKVKTNVKAGSMPHNHNRTMARGLKIKTGVKAGPSDSPVIHD